MPASSEPRPPAKGAALGSSGREVADPCWPVPIWTWCASPSVLFLLVIYSLVAMGHASGLVLSLGCAGVCAACFFLIQLFLTNSLKAENL